MHRIHINGRLVAVMFAALVAVVAFSSFGTPRSTHAVETDASGVICGTFTGMTLDQNMGDGPQPFYTGPFGMALSRIDHNTATGDYTLTAIAYTDTAIIGTPNLTWPDCKTEQVDPPALAIPPDIDNDARPSILGTFSGKNLGGSTCQAAFTFGTTVFPGFTKVSPSIDVAAGDNGISGTFEFEGEYADPNCTTPVGTLATFLISLTGTYYAGPIAGSAVDSSNWDKDGCSDWDEMHPDAFPGPAARSDPFVNDCEPKPVGGVAEIVDTASTPLETASSSGSSSWLIASIAAAAVVGAMALGGAATYARRRTNR